MLISNPRLALQLTRYGIQVPLNDSRDVRTWDELLKKYSHLHPTPLKDFPELTQEDFLRVHDPEFVEGLFSGGAACEKQLIQTYQLDDDEGLDYRPQDATRPLAELFETLKLHGSGTYLALKKALEASGGLTYFLGGGLHHAMSFGGRGFCLFNDAVVALEKLKAEGKIKSAWVVDIDAHKGDGTAELASTREWLKTLSLHMKEGWPLDPKMQDDPKAPWLIPSDLDIELTFGEEAQYLERLSSGLQKMKQKFSKPDVVWVVGGADPYEADELPSTQLMKLTLEQLLERDKMVNSFFKNWGVSQAWGMAGGYGENSWKVYFQFLDWVLNNAGYSKDS